MFALEKLTASLRDTHAHVDYSDGRELHRAMADLLRERGISAPQRPSKQKKVQWIPADERQDRREERERQEAAALAVIAEFEGRTCMTLGEIMPFLQAATGYNGVSTDPRWRSGS